MSTDAGSTSEPPPKRNVDWLYWGPYLLAALGWRVVTGIAGWESALVEWGGIAVVGAAFAVSLWGGPWLKRRREAKRLVGEHDAAAGV